MSKLLVALAFVGLNFWVYHFMANEQVIPERESFETFPLVLEEWSCPGPDEMEPDVLANLGATDYMLCNYVAVSPPRRVNLYVGYHETQIRKEGGGAAENSIHPPEHCLPGAGWDVIDARLVKIDLPGATPDRDVTGDAKRFVIAKGKARALVYFWYQSRGRVIARNTEVIVYRFFDRLTRGRTDGALVRFTIPIPPEGEEAADEIFRRFAPLVTAELSPHIPG